MRQIVNVMEKNAAAYYRRHISFLEYYERPLMAAAAVASVCLILVGAVI